MRRKETKFVEDWPWLKRWTEAKNLPFSWWLHWPYLFQFWYIQKELSSNVANLQNHFDLFDKTQKKELKLQKNAVLNAHLCLNAETRLKHTEYDSSYTVICVPPQPKETTIHGEYNKAKFEFNITENTAFVTPLNVGTIMVYSGFLLTYR